MKGEVRSKGYNFQDATLYVYLKIMCIGDNYEGGFEKSSTKMAMPW